MFNLAFEQLFRAVNRVRLQLETADPELRPFLAQELNSLRKLSEQYIDHWMELEEQILELIDTYQLYPVADKAEVVFVNPLQPEQMFMFSPVQKSPQTRPPKNPEPLHFNEELIDSTESSTGSPAMDSAEFDIAKAVFSWPDEATTQFRRGLAYYDLLMFESARTELEAVLAQVDSVVVHLYLAAVLAVQGKSRESKAHLETVVSHTEDEAILAASLEIEAQLFLAEGDLQRACQAYQVITQHTSVYLDAWFNLGLCQAKLGNYKRAEQAFLRVLQEEPGDVEALLLLSSVQQYSSSVEVAYQTCRLALTESPGHAGLRLHQSRLLDQMGKTKASLQVALRLSDDNLHDQRILSWAVWLLLKTGKSSDAIGRLKRFLTLHRNDPLVLLQLGVALLLVDNPDAAEPMLWAALPNSHDKSMLWLALGAVSASRGAHQQAEKRFLRAMRDTRSAVRRLALYQYALSLEALGKLEEAQKYLHLAHVSGPRSAAILAAMADNALKLGRSEEAKQHRIEAQNLAVLHKQDER